ncbi:MAG: cupin domain-containing protein [Polyangiales bacterium]
MASYSDSSGLFDAERREYYAKRPGFHINELQLAPGQSVPWHYHTNIQDTFYVLAGRLRISLRNPDEEVILDPSETFSVRPQRPHRVTPATKTSANFLVLQGIGEYDFVPVD